MFGRLVLTTSLVASLTLQCTVSDELIRLFLIWLIAELLLLIPFLIKNSVLQVCFGHFWYWFFCVIDLRVLGFGLRRLEALL